MNKRIAGIGLGVLVVNSGYLAAFAQPSIFYMGNVLLHLGLGLGLMALAAWWARRYPWECGGFRGGGGGFPVAGPAGVILGGGRKPGGPPGVLGVPISGGGGGGGDLG